MLLAFIGARHASFRLRRIKKLTARRREDEADRLIFSVTAQRSMTPRQQGDPQCLLTGPEHFYEGKSLT